MPGGLQHTKKYKSLFLHRTGFADVRLPGLQKSLWEILLEKGMLLCYDSGIKQGI